MRVYGTNILICHTFDSSIIRLADYLPAQDRGRLQRVWTRLQIVQYQLERHPSLVKSRDQQHTSFTMERTLNEQALSSAPLLRPHANGATSDCGMIARSKASNGTRKKATRTERDSPLIIKFAERTLRSYPAKIPSIDFPILRPHLTHTPARQISSSRFNATSVVVAAAEL